jgi:hypothetical protein
MLTGTENNLLGRISVSSAENFDPKGQNLGSQKQRYYFNNNNNNNVLFKLVKNPISQ